LTLPVPDAIDCARTLLSVPLLKGGAGDAVQVTCEALMLSVPEIKSPFAWTVSCHEPEFCCTRTATTIGALLMAGTVSGSAEANVIVDGVTLSVSFWADADDAWARSAPAAIATRAITVTDL
jgi:hypothetical protein